MTAEAFPEPGMSYARKRLGLGITAVGSTVLLCAASVWFNLPQRLTADSANPSLAASASVIAAALVVHALLLLPVDLVGGTIVVPERPPVASWIAAWARGVAVQLGCFVLCALLLMRVGQQYGASAAIVVFVLLQLFLLGRQDALASLVGGVSYSAPSAALITAAAAVDLAPGMLVQAQADDRSFVGAWIGVGARRLVVPSWWVQQLTAAQLQVALLRRVFVRERGMRTRGALVAVAWNTVGLTVALQAPHAGVASAADMVQTIAWFTLWSFVGVLVLPSLSRPAVYAADRGAAAAVGSAPVRSTVGALDAWQDDESERAPGIEAIFHPVPARSARLRGLDVAPPDASAAPSGAWHATRMMLYLSWAGAGSLSRAVHCNVGRPSLWVMFPGD
jgi:hypothetical protein